MPRRIIDFDDPDRFAPAVLGEPGEQTFYLQAEQGRRIAAVAIEREQVEVLAERMLAVVDELERRGLTAIDTERGGVADEDPPVDDLPEAFQASTLTIAWDEDVDRLIVEARSPMFDVGAGESAVRAVDDLDEDEIPDDAPIGPDVLRVHLKPLMAQRFARQAGRLVRDGRPACPFCGRPIDPRGHLCPRRGPSGYRH